MDYFSYKIKTTSFFISATDTYFFAFNQVEGLWGQLKFDVAFIWTLGLPGADLFLVSDVV
jgi:hypothetical protein